MRCHPYTSAVLPNVVERFGREERKDIERIEIHEEDQPLPISLTPLSLKYMRAYKRSACNTAPCLKSKDTAKTEVKQSKHCI